ncbi:MAG: hypothetical protein AAGF97_11790, partial [Planctomycetota bacterium]
SNFALYKVRLIRPTYVQDTWDVKPSRKGDCRKLAQHDRTMRDDRTYESGFLPRNSGKGEKKNWRMG